MGYDLFNSLDFDQPFVFLEKNEYTANSTLDGNALSRLGIGRSLELIEEYFRFYDLREPTNSVTKVPDDVVIGMLQEAFHETYPEKGLSSLSNYVIANGPKKFIITDPVNYRDV